MTVPDPASLVPPSVQRGFVRPPRLGPGSRVAALSLSSGFVTEVMNRYRAGVGQVAREFRWEVVAAPNALRGPEFLAANPQARADDLHWALQSADIDGMVSIIGGDDSVRLLPLLRPDLIRAHPKALLGFSDSTVTLTQFLRAGVMAYHGPALLTDLAENGGMHPFTVQGLRRALVDPPAPFELEAAPEWTQGGPDWADEAAQEVPRTFLPGDGWVWLQGDAPAQGHLAGAAGLILARPRTYTPGMVEDLHGWVRRVLAEAGRAEMPVVANVDFGHTSPQLTLPLGAPARLDPRAGRVTVWP
ncbi:LD-carboxypeptidase [Deinococcus aquaticus]|uniref:LD-carboxypeptidase n=1 Tax=Deinococcus aquaticus TaxID=328692 RepID=A0ABY7V3L6_9DEIO|nr:LD-carboxypeptidase [Deinococcus aquaticus]WDA59421.1 LD-carboxypeptidase [Deinococcus aquaticus]